MNVDDLALLVFFEGCDNPFTFGVNFGWTIAFAGVIGDVGGKGDREVDNSLDEL